MRHPLPNPTRPFGWIGWTAIAALVCVALFIIPTGPGSPHSGSAYNGILNNLLVIENQKQLWMADHKRTLGDTPTAEELAPYFNGRKFPQAAVGETYNINAIGKPVTATLTRPLKTSKGVLPVGSQIVLEEH